MECSSRQFPLSAFSVPDHPAASIGKEYFTAAREAEVYLAYGRKQEAQGALDKAVASGEMSVEEVAAFWANRLPEKTVE